MQPSAPVGDDRPRMSVCPPACPPSLGGDRFHRPAGGAAGADFDEKHRYTNLSPCIFFTVSTRNLYIYTKVGLVWGAGGASGGEGEGWGQKGAEEDRWRRRAAEGSQGY